MDHRTDIYSLGVTLYELLTLRPAFAGDDRADAGRAGCSRTTRRAPGRSNRAIPRDLETIVLKAMAKEPQQRYATAQELADDLQRFLADEPIRAKRTGPVVRLKKWTKRHKAVTAVVAATLVAATIFGTVTAVQAYQRDVRLTAMATEGLADVRVAMAQKEFGQAQRRATRTPGRTGGRAEGRGPVRPGAGRHLHQAEVRLRCSDLKSWPTKRGSPRIATFGGQVRGDFTKSRRSCQEALAVFRAG